MEDWVVELQGGRPEAAWDRFLERYRRLIFAVRSPVRSVPERAARDPPGGIRGAPQSV